MNRVFFYSFVDELEKLSDYDYKGELARSSEKFHKAHAEAQTFHWDDVVRKMRESVLSKFPAKGVANPKALPKMRVKIGSFEDMIHHPLVQAIGYLALAGEGIHAMSSKEWLGAKMPKIQSAFHGTRPGKAFGLGALGLSTAFLGAEGIAALTGWKRPKEQKIRAFLSK